MVCTEICKRLYCVNRYCIAFECPCLTCIVLAMCTNRCDEYYSAFEEYEDDMSTRIIAEDKKDSIYEKFFCI